VEIFTDAAGARIGVRLAAPPGDLPPNRLVEVDIRRRRLGGADAVEVSTSNPTLYREFYAFACAVADRVQIERLPASAAVESALDNWAALLQRLAILDDARQIGLLGEIWLLSRLALRLGWDEAVQAWKGADAEEHDFSCRDFDIEVKTTLAERRIHVIGSLTQLAPTADRPLYILSLQLTGAGAGPGESLADAVARVERDAQSASEAARQRLNALLGGSGWRPEHAPHYSRRFSLRTAPCLVAVDDLCPSITPGTLSGLGSEKLARIGQVVYRVDLTGLGHEEGHPSFDRLLPS
jgi:hypothetical protein